MNQPAQRRIRLLEMDPDLGADLRPDAFAEAARVLSLPVVELPVGKWRPPDVRDAARYHGQLLGCVVVRGLVTRDVTLAGRTSTLIYGPRDLLSLDELGTASLPLDVHFHVLAPAMIGLLDDSFLVAGQRWPQITGRLIDAATSQLGRVSADQAISQLPRVEDRLVALFWHFADRWGRRRSGDVAIDLPLTHEALGRLIGARRPTVSLGLRQLADDGLLHRDGEDWILSVSSVEELGGTPRVRRRQGAAATPATTTGPLPGELSDRIAVLRTEFLERKSATQKAISSNRELLERLARGKPESVPSE